jgi:hypothetical protein
MRARLRRLPFARMFTDGVLVGEGWWSAPVEATAVVLSAAAAGRTVQRTRRDPGAGTADAGGRR